MNTQNIHSAAILVATATTTTTTANPSDGLLTELLDAGILFILMNWIMKFHLKNTSPIFQSLTSRPVMKYDV